MSGGSLLSTSLTTGDSANPRIVGGHGVWFQLSDGREVIDASNTAAPLGHCHPEIIAAVRRAADAPVINEGWQWAEREEAADDLLRIAFAGEDWAGAVRFFISASEANDCALALCQALTGRKDLATRERAYHGGAGLARELTVQPQWHGGLAGAGGPGGAGGPDGRGADRHQRRADLAVPCPAARHLRHRAQPGLRRPAPRPGTGRRRAGGQPRLTPPEITRRGPGITRRGPGITRRGPEITGAAGGQAGQPPGGGRRPAACTGWDAA
jgi:hypothetical protein